MLRTPHRITEDIVVFSHIQPFIEKTLKWAWKELLIFLKQYERCDIPTFYHGQKSLDYSHPVIQHLYILKYFPAYLFEYTKMYMDIFKKGQEHGFTQFNVLSLGCGCGLDFYGLHFAQKISEIPLDSIKYRGIDCNKWQHPNLFPKSSIFHIFGRFGIESTSIQDVLKQSNIIVFPKSLGDFSKDAFNIFLDFFRLNKQSQPIIVAANITSEEGASNMDALLRTFGCIDYYEIGPDCFDAQSDNSSKKAIRSIPEWKCWEYPNDIKDKIIAWLETTKGQSICGLRNVHSNPNEYEEKTWVMLSYKYVQYRIAMLYDDIVNT